MIALIDTHLLVWWFLDARELPAGARACIEDGSNRVLVSCASLWELAIKVSRGRIELKMERMLAAIEREGFEMLPIRPSHTLIVASLPWHHADPFDRLLVAQARSEGLRLLTADRALAKYGEPVTVV